MNNTVKILIADDEERWRRLVGDFLRNEGYKTVEAANGQEAVDLIRQDSDISMAILDIMMPVMDGTQACKAIREFSDLPIIMLTAKSDEDSEVMGFVCGADEYISKPVKFPVFTARVRALLKRSVSMRSQVEVAGICIDPDAHTVTIDGQEINLTPREFELLLYVAQNKNIALSRDKLLSDIWGYDFFGDARTLDTHVKLLRKSLGRYAGAIVTLRGVGYRFEA